MDDNQPPTEAANIDQQRDLSRRDGRKFSFITGAISILWIIAIIYLNNNSVISSLREKTSEKIEFNLREYLHKTPPISPQLRIFAIDDQTVTYLKTADLSTLQWAKTLANISAKKPRAILIDKLFGGTPPDNAETREARKILENIKTPLFSGVHAVQTKAGDGITVSIAPGDYNIGDLFKRQPFPANISASLPPLVNREKCYLYGYDSWYNGIFKVGHFNYNDDKDGMVAPVVKYNGGKLLPHLALAAFTDGMYVKDRVIYVNGNPMPMDSAGKIKINHRPQEMYKIYAIRFALERAMKGERETRVDEGDIVLIISNYSGGVDFHEGAPFGEITGGFIPATLIDAALTNSWLKRLEIDSFMIFVMCGLGILIGMLSKPVQFWTLSILISVLLFGTGMYLFIFQATIFPWLMPWIGFMVSGMIHFANQSIQNELKKVSIRRDYFAEKARRLEEENKKIQLEESLALGRAIQNLLLPKQYNGQFSHFSYEMKYTPSYIMSGDWLYIWQVSASEQRIIIGDVMGKGPSAAIGVAIIIGALKEAEISHLSMYDALLRVNERMIELFAAQITTTCAAVVLRDNNQVDLYNAGTPGWFLSSASKQEIHHLRGNSLGIEPSFKPATTSIDFPSGALLFTFTDGYLEGSRATRRLMRAMEQRQVYDHHVDTLHEVLMQSGEGHRLVDDRSLLAIKAQ